MEGEVFGVSTFAGKETCLNPFIWVSNNGVTEDYLREPLFQVLCVNIYFQLSCLQNFL